MKKSKNIKKQIGEKAYKFLILNFNEDFLSENLPKVFGIVSDVRDLSGSDLPKLKNLLCTMQDTVEDTVKDTRTAKEILESVGYKLDDTIETKKDYIEYRKYYASGEALCKFGGYEACDNYHRIFWIYKKNIDDIKRSDFLGKEKRQDEYGTSCMSVGISKNKKNIAQICNRYNHKVSAPDNTFNSNLDNIVIGLTEAFNRDYSLSLGTKMNIEFENFYESGGKLWYYSHEINGKKYGNNTIDGTYYNADEFLIFDNFILDLKNKVIKSPDNLQDDFCRIVNEKLQKGAKIEIRKGIMPDDIQDDENKIIIFKTK